MHYYLMNYQGKKNVLLIKQCAIPENTELSTWKHTLESTDAVIVAISKLQLALRRHFRELIIM